VCPRDGDPTNISQFAKNLVANMRDGAPPHSVMYFVWEEIKGISMNPQKTCGLTPCLMFITEDVTSRNFPKEGKRMPFRPNPTKKPLIPLAQVSSPPRANPTPQQHTPAKPVRRVAVNRDNLLDSNAKGLPLPSRRCLGSCLECVALTMPSR
jgi:hypothetical protein